MNTLQSFPEIQQRIVLAPYTTLRIGGPADYFYVAKTITDLARIVHAAESDDLPYFVLGSGANTLFPDDGFRGLVVKNECKRITMNGTAVTAESGVLSTQLTAAAQRQGLTGIEEWIALPGTVGGAIRGNAGCFGVEVKDRLISAKIAYLGRVEEITPEYLNFGYRDSTLKSNPRVVLEGTFALKEGDPVEIKKRILEYTRSRRAKQPAGKTVGSFFKNPPGDHAGRLIEAIGYKGKNVGDIQISPQHANFIMNTGNGTAEQVHALMHDVQEKVRVRFGIELEPEVHIVVNSEIQMQKT